LPLISKHKKGDLKGGEGRKEGRERGIMEGGRKKGRERRILENRKHSPA